MLAKYGIRVQFPLVAPRKDTIMNPEIQHQLSQLEIHRNNLIYSYLPQYATLGNITPPGIMNGIRYERNEITRIKKLLREYYNTTVDDMPGVDYDRIDEITLKIDRATYERIRAIVATYGIDLPGIE